MVGQNIQIEVNTLLFTNFTYLRTLNQLLSQNAMYSGFLFPNPK